MSEDKELYKYPQYSNMDMDDLVFLWGSQKNREFLEEYIHRLDVMKKWALEQLKNSEVKEDGNKDPD